MDGGPAEVGDAVREGAPTPTWSAEDGESAPVLVEAVLGYSDRADRAPVAGNQRPCLFGAMVASSEDSRALSVLQSGTQDVSVKVPEGIVARESTSSRVL